MVLIFIVGFSLLGAAFLGLIPHALTRATTSAVLSTVLAGIVLFFILEKIVASLAVISHEIPQEIGDFAILLESGYSRNKAFLYNAISAISTLPGALMAYLFLLEVQTAIPYVMALSAASFIYIAIADLFPTLHRYMGLRQSMRQLFLILAGIGTISMFHLRQGA